MASVLEVLKQGVSHYPVPMATLSSVAVVRGIDLSAEATVDLLLTPNYRLADADIKLWVSTAPNISQDSISFDLLASTRESLRQQANAVYKEFNDGKYVPEKTNTVKYGYKGKKL